MLKHFDHVTCHITVALKDAAPRLEVQLLHFLEPPVKAEGGIRRLDRCRTSMR